MATKIHSLLKMKPSELKSGWLFGSGTTVPVDGTAGYLPGAIWQKTNGGAGTSVWINEGTEAACDFDAISPSAAGDLADLTDIASPPAYTSGSILVANGSAYAEVAVSGQATLASTGAVTIPLLGATAGSVAVSKAVITDAYKTVRFGDWVAAQATGSGIVLAATLNKYSDGQVDIFSVFGESTTNLTSSYSSKCGRFRHLVNGITCGQEAYGAVGQIVAKNVTFTECCAGLLGTLESSTAVTLNGAYTFSNAAVIGRLGLGSAITTATKPACGFLAFQNSVGALSSGSTIAHAAAGNGTATWDYLLGAAQCNSFLYVPTATAYECGVKVTPISSMPSLAADGVIRIKVNATNYYIPIYVVANVTGA